MLFLASINLIFLYGSESDIAVGLRKYNFCPSNPTHSDAKEHSENNIFFYVISGNLILKIVVKIKGPLHLLLTDLILLNQIANIS